MARRAAQRRRRARPDDRRAVRGRDRHAARPPHRAVGPSHPRSVAGGARVISDPPGSPAATPGPTFRLRSMSQTMTATAVDISSAKRDVAIANRVLWALGLCTGVTASLGHASMRIPGQPDRFLVKGRGYKMDALAAMRP